MNKKSVLLGMILISCILLSGCKKVISTKENADEKFSFNTESKNDVNSEMENTKETEVVTSGDNEYNDNHIVMQEQSFDVELDSWGKVRFVSCRPNKADEFEDAYFYIVEDNKVIYTLPYYYSSNIRSNGVFADVTAVAFRDINEDSTDDIIIIITYNTGAGPQGMLPFSEARLFIADDKKFTLDRKLTDAINEGNVNMDITSITDYIEKHVN